MAEKTLYEELGGEAAVELAVDKFYDKVLADDRVKHFFEGLDMARQRKMQASFLKFAFGGPFHYNGRGMRAAHKKLALEKGMGDSHFDAIVELLASTLSDLGIGQHLIDQVAAKCETLRNDVLCKEEKAELPKA